MINKIILGTVQLGLPYGINNSVGKPDKKEAFNILQMAFNEGIDFLDTALDYGDSQAIIGEFFNDHPQYQCKILSKFIPLADLSIETQVEQILKQLNRKQIECLSYHRFEDAYDSSIKKSLASFKANGVIEHIGASVYTNREFEVAISMDHIDTIQLPFNLLDNWTQRGHLIKEAKNKGKEIHVRSVFLQGLFFKNLNEFPQKLSPLTRDVKALNDLAHKYGLSLGEMALAYPCSCLEIDKVLVGAESTDQVRGIVNMLKDEIPSSLKEEIDLIATQQPELLDPRNWK